MDMGPTGSCRVISTLVIILFVLVITSSMIAVRQGDGLCDAQFNTIIIPNAIYIAAAVDSGSADGYTAERLPGRVSTMAKSKNRRFPRMSSCTRYLE
jgi:hypothetical protein